MFATILAGSTHTGAHNVLADQITLAAMAVAFIEWLKGRAWFPWITAHTDQLNRMLSAFLAAGAAVGITVSWDPEAHALTIAGLTLIGILTAGYAWLKQFIFQELTYRVVKRGNGAVAKA